MADEINANTGAGNTSGETNANAGGQNAGNNPDGQSQDPEVYTFNKKTLAERLARAERQSREKVLNELKTKGLLLDEPVTGDSSENTEQTTTEHQPGKPSKELEKLRQEKLVVEKALKEREAEWLRKFEDSQRQNDAMKVQHSLSAALAVQPIRTDIRREDLEQLVLAEGSIRVEDGKVVVVDADGNAKLSRRPGGEFMSVDEFVESWLATREWALAPTGATGPGVRPAQHRGTKLPADWLTMPHEEFTKLSPEQKKQAFELAGLTTRGGGGFTFARPKPITNGQ